MRKPGRWHRFTNCPRTSFNDWMRVFGRSRRASAPR
jgi:hypothetical protein